MTGSTGTAAGSGPPGLDASLVTSVIYTLVWEYRERWRALLTAGSVESEGFAYVEGVVDGAINGRFRGTNSARQRSDGRFMTDVQGVILGDDDLVISLTYQGVGCPYPRDDEPLHDRTKVTVAARHQTSHPAWSHLNDAVCVGVGENRFTADGTRLALFDVHEVLWENLDERATERPALPSRVEIAEQPFDLEALATQRRAR